MREICVFKFSSITPELNVWIIFMVNPVLECLTRGTTPPEPPLRIGMGWQSPFSGYPVRSS
ncbi:MAG: hypothetical protein PHP59_06235, partial [Methanofollis sp.]|uniref:hypothetical protein n=1 Tax=Methanofollis sp. TaxID=2052835 RepID=UPI0026154411